MTNHEVAEVAHWIGLVPLGWLAVTGKHDRAWWWLGVAFGVSFLADLGAHLVSPWVMSVAYPVSQAALVMAVFLPRRDAQAVTLVLVLVGLLSVVMGRAAGPDLFLHTVAWGGTAWIVNDYATGRLKAALLVAFGGGLLAWWGYVLLPAWPTWIAFQSTRLVAAGWFCWAASHPVPKLKLA